MTTTSSTPARKQTVTRWSRAKGLRPRPAVVVATAGIIPSLLTFFVTRNGDEAHVHSVLELKVEWPAKDFEHKLRLAATKAPIATGHDARSVARVGAGEIILAVEDNQDLRRVVIRHLTWLGHRTIEAESAASAIAVLETEKVDLVFTDIVMPGPLDGFDLAREVLTRWPHIKIVPTSGFAAQRLNGDLGEMATSARLLSKPREQLAPVLHDALVGA
jgi:CheY-like chemotaxis protein